ncbi:hypothetical protein [Anabaena catenula]|uniref:Uncharacterized protein n=1 Tax=Anabaena catenula FACHB-362 TaxID=2692877 RepID=A0ABR8J3C3_9NOST|nr:hypothetical protein [Anabaena catenula]MBD2692060.1 hypothetical protein [Anabaena catenula FACHB-362]
MRRSFTYGVILLFSIIIIIIWWPVNDSNCSLVDVLKLKTRKFQVQASQVIVKPWHGEHNIYGIFMVPDEYKETPFFMLTVPGNRQYCSRPFGYSENYDDVVAKPGTHLIRYYIRSRIAIKMIFQGLYSQLNNPQNWTLTFPKPKVN